MMRFRYSNAAPPGGKWFYRLNGLWFESYHGKNDLLDKVRKHYAVNGKEVPANLDEIVCDFICQQLPDGFCEGEREGKPDFEAKPLTYFEVVMELEKLFRGRKYRYVDSRTAKDHGTVCYSCPANRLGMCTTCNGLRGTASKFIGGRTVSGLDDYLGVCAAYRVPASALIHVEPVTFPVNRPATCWTRAYERTATKVADSKE